MKLMKCGTLGGTGPGFGSPSIHGYGSFLKEGEGWGANPLSTRTWFTGSKSGLGSGLVDGCGFGDKSGYGDGFPVGAGFANRDRDGNGKE